MVGTEQWIQALYQVQDEINKITLDKKEKEFTDAYDKLKQDLGGKITIEALLDKGDLETQLNEIMNKDYAISIEIHSQAEQAFTQISTAMDNIKKQAALIGEDFIVSADNARALGNTFPGIYEQAEISATGQIKLNKDIAQSAIQRAQEEVTANAKSTVEKLQNARDELKSKQMIYQGMAKAAWALATGEMDADKTEADYKAEIETGLDTLRKEAEDSEKQSNQRVADNAKDNAEITAGNWGRSYQNAAEFAVKFANKAIEAAENIANGKKTSGVRASDFNVNYQGKNGVSGEAQEIQNYQDLLNKALSGGKDKESLAKLAQSWENAATALGEQVNDIDSMIIASGAKTLETVKGLGQTGSAASSGSSKNPSEEKENKDELDRYQKVNSQLQIIANTLSDIDKKKSKLFGKGYIEELNKEIKALNRQIDLTNQKLDIQKEEQIELQERLKKEGIAFAEGIENEQYIINYKAIWQAKHEALNKEIRLYNAMSAEEQEAYKKILEAHQEDWQNFEKDIQRYDTLLNDIHTSLDNNEEALRKKIADNVERFDLEIQIRLDMEDAAKEWDTFRREVLDNQDNLFKLGTFDNTDLIRTAKEDFDLLRTYFDERFESAVDGSEIFGSGIVGPMTRQLKDLRQEVENAFINDPNGIFGDETQTAMDKLAEFKTRAIQTATEIKQKMDDFKDVYINTLKEANEKFEDQADLLERVGKYLEHDAKLVKLIYGENQYTALSKYYQKQHDNNIAQLDFSKQQVDFWKEQMENAEENSREWEYAKEQWLAAIDDANSKLEQAVETAKEKWENAIDEVFDKLDKTFTNDLGLDYIKEEWTLINKNADEYLDAINSAYGIQKLENKYLDAIDKTDNVGHQRRLNELMKSEITALQQIDKLTQSDLDRAELKYQIALKELELEEAKQNKTTMRLRRDSQGNYNYQFVANDNAIDKAREELEDLKNKLYNFDLKAYRTNLDKAASAYEEYMQKMAEAAKIVDEEERTNKMRLIQEQYQEYIVGLTEQNERLKTNLIESATEEHGDLYDEEAEYFENMTEKEIDVFMGELVPQWDSGVQQMIDKWSGPNGFKETTLDAIDELMDKNEEYREDLDEIQETADVDFEEIRDAMDETRLEALDPLIEGNEDLIDTYKTQVKTIRNELIPWLEKLKGKYSDLITEIKEANRLQGIKNEERAADAHEDYEKLMSKEPDETFIEETPIVEEAIQEEVEETGTTGTGLYIGKVISGYTGKYYEKSDGTGSKGTRKSGKPIKIDTFSSVDYGGTQVTGPYAIHISDAATGGWLGWVKPEWLEGFKTGGYTGEWGSDGKLAMLHQKELILNAQDTSNFLNALDIMRNIVNNIGSEAFSRLASIGGNRIGDPAFAGIEQNIVINADFPNATDHSEIQQAFDNLLNIASQRVNKNRM